MLSLVFLCEEDYQPKMFMAAVVFIMLSIQKINFSNISPNQKSYFGS